MMWREHTVDVPGTSSKCAMKNANIFHMGKIVKLKTLPGLEQLMVRVPFAIENAQQLRAAATPKA